MSQKVFFISFFHFCSFLFGGVRTSFHGMMQECLCEKSHNMPQSYGRAELLSQFYKDPSRSPDTTFTGDSHPNGYGYNMPTPVEGSFPSALVRHHGSVPESAFP